MSASLLRRAALCLGVVASFGAVGSDSGAPGPDPSGHVVGVRWSATDDLARLAPLRFVAPGLAIVAADAATAARLRAAGLDVVFEDRAPEGEDWYLADHLHGPTRPAGVHVVHADPSGWALLRLPRARLAALLDDEDFLYPLPARYAPPRAAAHPAPRLAARVPAASVAALADCVDVDRLRRSVESLTFVDPAAGAVHGNVRSRYARRPETFASTDWLRQQLAASLGDDAVHLDTFRIASGDSLMYNVVGELAGTDPDAGTWIICAHYDAIGTRSSRADLARVGETPGRWDWTVHPAPGADDNGSGVAVVLESARLLAGAGPFPWSIRFIAWSGEELGLWGSRHYADAAGARGDRILGVLNFDMVGFNDLADRLQLVTNPQSVWLVDLLRATNERYALGLRVDVLEDRFAGLSDHQPFWTNGYDAILGIENYLPTDTTTVGVRDGLYRINSQYHSVTDLPDSINWELVARVTRLTVAALAQFGAEDGLPNLAVFDGDLRGGDDDDLHLQVANLGPVAVTAPFAVRVSACAADSTDCSPVFEQTVSGGVDAGGAAVFDIPWQRYGQAVFLVEVDPDGRVAEEAEDDNRAFQGVRLVPGSRVVVYPNPFRPGQDEALRFSGVPLFSRLRIYGADGAFVWKGLEEDQRQASREILWSGVNAGGYAVSPGIYLYDLRSFEGELLERGKIAVIR